MGLFGYLHCSLHVIAFSVNMRTDQKRGKSNWLKLCMIHKIQKFDGKFFSPDGRYRIESGGQNCYHI